jgi:hypothetical protein
MNFTRATTVADREPRIVFDRFRAEQLYEELRGDSGVDRSRASAAGFFKMSQNWSLVLITTCAWESPYSSTSSSASAQHRGTRFAAGAGDQPHATDRGLHGLAAACAERQVTPPR